MPFKWAEAEMILIHKKEDTENLSYYYRPITAYYPNCINYFYSYNTANRLCENALNLISRENKQAGFLFSLLFYVIRSSSSGNLDITENR